MLCVTRLPHGSTHVAYFNMLVAFRILDAAVVWTKAVIARQLPLQLWPRAQLDPIGYLVDCDSGLH